jgi:ATP-binding cassette, subfamily B, bacterial
LLHAFESKSEQAADGSVDVKKTLSETATETVAEADNETLRPPKPSLTWLDPTLCRFSRGPLSQLELWQGDSKIGSGVFIVRTFPASYPQEYLSVRGWDVDGDEIELGMIRELKDWPESEQRHIHEALQRRYLLREITGLYSIALKYGFLDFDVETTTGRTQFSMRWTQSQAIDFGENGKLIIDTEENRYLLSDINRLSAADQERFQQYVYW